MKEKSKNRTLEILLKSIRLIVSFDKKYLFVMGIHLILDGLEPMVELLLIKEAMKKIQTHDTSFEMISALLVACLGVKILTEVVNSYVTRYTCQFKYEFNKDLEIKLFDSISRMNCEDFEKPETYNLLNRVEAQKVDSVLTSFSQFTNIVRSVISVCGMIYIVAEYSLILLGIFIISPIAQYIVVFRLNKEQFEMILKRTPIERKVWYIGYLMTSGGAFKEIKLFGLNKYLLKEFDKWQNIVMKQDLSFIKKSLSARKRV